MNREQLKELGLTDEQVDSVMKFHGKTVQDLKPAQEELDNVRNEKATLEQQLADLQGTLEAKETELQGIDDLKNEVETYKLKDLKTSIAVQAGIPLELAGRLSGSTEEEIKADAENLVGFVGKKDPLPLKQTEPNKSDGEEQAYASMIDKLT